MHKVRMVVLICAGLAHTVIAGAPKTRPPSAPPTATNFTLNAVITNTSPPVVASIIGAPAFIDHASDSAYGMVFTDGSGKIDGVQDLIFSNLDLCEFTAGDFVSEIAGSLATVGGTKNSRASTVVEMTIKGNGYVQNALGTTQAPGTLNLTFKGSLFASNSAVTVTGTNTFLLISTTNGVASTNENTYYAQTNINHAPSYQELVFFNEQNTINYQDSLSLMFPDVYPFGTTLSTNGEYTINPRSATNNFNNVVIGYSNTISGAPGTLTVSTNPIYGLDGSQVPAFVAAYLAPGGTNLSSNVYTNTGANPSEVSLVTAVFTNTVQGSDSTNISLFVDENGNTNDGVFSSSWYGVGGQLKGQISSGSKCKQSFNKTNASFAMPYAHYTLMTGSGSNTAAPYFGTNQGDGRWIATNDSGVTYVISETPDGATLAVNPLSTVLHAAVKQFGKAIWVFGGQGEFGLDGAGAMDPKSGAYKVAFRGVGRLSGSSLVVTGATATNVIVGYTGLTVTNLAAVANYSLMGLSNFPVSVSFANQTLYMYNNNFVAANNDMIPVVTNGVTNFYISTFFYNVPVQLGVVTNTVDSIRTFSAIGKMLGQRIFYSGTNADVPVISPLTTF